MAMAEENQQLNENTRKTKKPDKSAMSEQQC